jgi:hypothetical protein
MQSHASPSGSSYAFRSTYCRLRTSVSSARATTLACFSSGSLLPVTPLQQTPQILVHLRPSRPSRPKSEMRRAIQVNNTPAHGDHVLKLPKEKGQTAELELMAESETLRGTTTRARGTPVPWEPGASSSMRRSGLLEKEGSSRRGSRFD